MFNSIMVTYNLAAASNIIRALLERHSATGFFNVDAKNLSSKLVAMVYAQDENLFNGRKGPKPHKISVAALALAQGVRELEQDGDERAACRLSLGLILMDLEQRGGTYPFTDKDRAFIQLATQEYLDYDTQSIFDAEGAGGSPSVGEKAVRQSEPRTHVVVRSLDLELDQRKIKLDEKLANFQPR